MQLFRKFGPERPVPEICQIRLQEVGVGVGEEEVLRENLHQERRQN